MGFVLRRNQKAIATLVEIFLSAYIMHVTLYKKHSIHLRSGSDFFVSGGYFHE
ncbi:MAG: hypothetical protein KME21_09335 [Desmonostoc vinosum HA7617-LM4]|jgi:hypothetical protein|nr:hypothetical protein [Desmonostoc vinosum HA7617-LM4]